MHKYEVDVRKSAQKIDTYMVYCDRVKVDAELVLFLRDDLTMAQGSNQSAASAGQRGQGIVFYAPRESVLDLRREGYDQAPEEPPIDDSDVISILKTAQAGMRSHTLYWVATVIRLRGTPLEEALELLIPAANESGLGDREAERIVNRAYFEDPPTEDTGDHRGEHVHGMRDWRVTWEYEPGPGLKYRLDSTVVTAPSASDAIAAAGFYIADAAAYRLTRLCNFRAEPVPDSDPARYEGLTECVIVPARQASPRRTARDETAS